MGADSETGKERSQELSYDVIELVWEWGYLETAWEEW